MKRKHLQLLIITIILITSCKTSKYSNLKDGIYADIQTNKGDILLSLYAQETPLTVANFVSLAQGNNPKVADSLKGKKYYDGVTFHRVIKNFMIQSGDRTGTGSGTPGYAFADEFPKDSTGGLRYKFEGPGVLAMANSGPQTNGSQFFITHKDTPWLDGKHTIFGKVMQGQAVVDSIAKRDTIKHIEIIRVGSVAKKFDAPKIFLQELKKVEAKEKERLVKEEADKKVFQQKMGIDKAIQTDSGLKILRLKKGTGKKVKTSLKTTVNYTLYTATGKKIESSLDQKAPFSFIIDKQPLIAGWKEGVLTMRVGDKTRLFIPYQLAYGDSAAGPIPAKSDLVFDIEVLKVEK